MANLSCKILNKKFLNPIWLGSGTITDRKLRVDKFLHSRAGVVIPRTTRVEYSTNGKNHPSYHLHFNLKEGFIRNCEWTGRLINYWKPYLKELSKTGKVIMSVSGRDIKDCLKACEIIDKFKFPLIEINISCAHSNEINGFIVRDSEHIFSLIKTIKEKIKTPIAIKLGHSDSIVELAKIAESAGADAIVAINTYGPVIDFDIEKGVPKLILGISNGAGGLSGRPIFHIALTDIVHLSQNLKIPIIACGGIMNPQDAVKMIMAGANAVELYSAVHIAGDKGQVFLDKFIKEFSLLMDQYGYKNLDSMRGILLPKLTRTHQMKKKVPQIDREKCNKCGLCKNICLEGAIKLLNNKIIINNKKCIGCGACVSVCPVKALK